MKNNSGLLWGAVALVALGVIVWWLYPTFETWNQGAVVESGISGSSSSSSPGDGAVIPPAALSVRALLSADLGVPSESITVVSVTPMEWPDGCLGLPEEDKMCAQALVPGFRVVAFESGQEFTYRTNADGSIVRLESPRK